MASFWKNGGGILLGDRGVIRCDGPPPCCDPGPTICGVRFPSQILATCNIVDPADGCPLVDGWSIVLTYYDAMPTPPEDRWTGLFGPPPIDPVGPGPGWAGSPGWFGWTQAYPDGGLNNTIAHYHWILRENVGDPDPNVSIMRDTEMTTGIYLPPECQGGPLQRWRSGGTSSSTSCNTLGSVDPFLWTSAERQTFFGVDGDCDFDFDYWPDCEGAESHPGARQWTYTEYLG